MAENTQGNLVTTKRGLPVYRVNPSIPPSNGLATRHKRFEVPGGKAAVITGVTSYSAVTIGKNLYLADSSGDILSVAIDTIYGDAGGGPAAAVTTLTLVGAPPPRVTCTSWPVLVGW